MNQWKKGEKEEYMLLSGLKLWVVKMYTYNSVLVSAYNTCD